LEKAIHEAPRAYLLPYPIESFAKPILIASERTYFGRSPDGDIQIRIADRAVSRKHACIHSEDKHFIIEDLDSQNGTFLNSARIQKTRLSSHDKITIGTQTFLFLMQRDHVQALLAEPPVQYSDTISINHEEMDLSDLFAQNADHAARRFLHPAASDAPESTQVDSSAHTRLALLYQLSENLRNVSTIRDVYEQGLALIMETIPAAEITLVAEEIASNDTFNVVSYKLRDPGHSCGDTIPVSHSVFNWVLREKVVLVSQNLGRDLRFQDSDSIRVHDLRSILCVPISGKNGVLGLLYAQAHKLLNPFNKVDALFASAVANEMALNIDNIRLQKKLLNNERMAAIGLTISNLAHNINNLLAINQTSSQLMDVHIKEKDYPHIVKRWASIQNSFAGISKLSTDILEYAKEDKLHIQPVDINKLIRKSHQRFEEGLSHNDLKFDFELTPRNPIWEIDKIQLQRALLNLVLNAVDAVRGKEDGRIQIGTSVRKDHYLTVSVADNGCGIPKNKKGSVLDLFFTTKGSKGTGLGLPMVQKFIEKSGGQLKIQSQEGMGSVFEMVFPKTSH
jgi:signal transduction histidine kinase